MFGIVTLSLIVILITLILIHSKRKLSFFENIGVKIHYGCRPLIGHLTSLMGAENWNYFRNGYKLYSEDKVFGIYEFLTPLFFVCDPPTIKDIFVKDFSHFTDRRHIFKEDQDENNKSWFSEFLSAKNGQQWRKMRSTLSPAFSSGKLKQMYTIIEKQTKNFVTHCDRKMLEDSKIDLKKSFGAFTMGVIADTAFGIECNTLESDTTLFTQNAESLFKFRWSSIFKFFVFYWTPKIAKKFNITLDSEPMLFFKRVFEETMKERKGKNRDKGDFLDLLLDVQERQTENFDESKDYKITDTTILAQSALFFVAGFETTATTLTYSAFYLAKYPECQDKLREELKEIRENERFEYHSLMEAKYLDACISEALRLNSPNPILERQCVKDYKCEETNIIIKEGMRVCVPIWGIHRDPVYWPEPHEFKPERFLPENKSNIEPFTYMPFGLGPRNCIAMRFALMEAKQCLAELIINYNFTFAPGYGELKMENSGNLVRPKTDCVVMILEKI